MSKNLKLATLSVAVFAGLLIAYGYQTALARRADQHRGHI